MTVQLNQRPRPAVGLLVASTLLALFNSSGAQADPARMPFTLDCRLNGAESIRLRISEALQQIERIDPDSGEVLSTITTQRPPAELGGGIIDETSVTISAQEVIWEERMHRPQFVRESHRIDRSTLTYRKEEAFQIDMGPDMAREIRTGQCTRVDGVRTGFASPLTRP